MKKTRIIANIPQKHSWINNLANKGLIIEYLLDKEFGANYGETPEEKRNALAQKYVRAQEILENLQKE